MNMTTSMFLAVELDDDIKQLFAKSLYLLEYKDVLRIEPKRNFHITIGFIAHVEDKDRRDVINAFKGIKEFPPFMAEVSGGVIFGHYNQILCAKISPEVPFIELNEKAGRMLSETTEYAFDTSHEAYIPHTKIQTIRKAAGEKQADITEEFLNLNFHKLEFKVKNLALMQRKDKYYEIVYRYPLGSQQNGLQQARG